jgi:hypothetical protein
MPWRENGLLAACRNGGRLLTFLNMRHIDGSAGTWTLGASVAFLLALGVVDGCGGVPNAPGWGLGDDGGVWGSSPAEEGGPANLGGRSSTSSSGGWMASSGAGSSAGSGSGSSSGSPGVSAGGYSAQDAGNGGSYSDGSDVSTNSQDSGRNSRAEAGGCPTTCTTVADCQGCTGALQGYVWCCSTLVGCYSWSACGVSSSASSGGGGGGKKGSGSGG